MTRSGKRRKTDRFCRPTCSRGKSIGLMATPQALENMARNVSYWLWIERAPSREKDTTLFPEYTPSVQESLYLSGEAFVKDIVSSGKLGDLFTSTKIFVNKDISTVFGIPGGTSATLTPVNSTLPERSAGLLTQPALLAATNQRPGLVDPIHHGLFVLEDLLCGGDIGQIAGPPPDAFAKAAMMRGDERQLVDQRAKTSPCNGCHSNFDPYGLTRLTVRLDRSLQQEQVRRSRQYGHARQVQLGDEPDPARRVEHHSSRGGLRFGGTGRRCRSPVQAAQCRRTEPARGLLRWQASRALFTRSRRQLSKTRAPSRA